MSSPGKIASALDARLRLFVYRRILHHEKSPTVREMARALGASTSQIRASLERLGESHAFMTQDNGELWRAAPFSCIPTSFPVKIGRRSWFANCIWDALGIPAMLGQDALIEASCGCCNSGMPIEVRAGKLSSSPGLIHVAVAARDWYKDVVFT